MVSELNKVQHNFYQEKQNGNANFSLYISAQPSNLPKKNQSFKMYVIQVEFFCPKYRGFPFIVHLHKYGCTECTA